MKEELEKLGFVTADGKFPYYILDVNDDIRLTVQCETVSIHINGDGGDIFPYNHEKLKQLIQILS